MCLDAPALVVDVDRDRQVATVSSQGALRHASLVILTLDGESVAPGDWLLVNSGLAVRRITEQEAAEVNALLKEANQ